MSSVWFLSDLHIGHKNILKFEGPNRVGSTIEEHDDWIIDSINKTVQPRDTMYLLGDVSFTVEGLLRLKEINCGTMYLIKGNHDTFPLHYYTDVFSDIYGLHTKYDMWMSHAPVHADELRNKPNVHGHMHSRFIDDPRYANVCVEPRGGVPVHIDVLRTELGLARPR